MDVFISVLFIFFVLAFIFFKFVKPFINKKYDKKTDNKI